ncbi:hypothetical protein MLD38_015404 [Melastoma candidum]|uniref:Uncharacterized protein n=1 Tax=Melastoma candidum TaxID=119954 RepID=A0ACB9RFM3_9MYRT|nr:hypothetical protein MLD38_015404 [Melastoma candidum]
MDARVFTPFDGHLLAALHNVLDSAPDGSSHQSPQTHTYVRDAKAMASTPADVIETPAAYSFVIDMPGLKVGDIKVQVEDDNLLVISGERRREWEDGKDGKSAADVKYLRMERRVGKFMRKFVLPENADKDKVTAVCRDGVLTYAMMLGTILHGFEGASPISCPRIRIQVLRTFR